jgi:hypothetical protein
VCSDADNSELCQTFSEFFVSKISTLKSSIYSQLARLSPPQFYDPPYLGPVLDCRPPVTSAEVLKLLTLRPVKSSFIDFIPSTLLKSCPGVFSELIAFLANLSFSQGCFPSRFRHASVTPLLKKPSLDKLLPSNYRPISNLINISKLLERLFLNRIQSHILSSPHFNSYQSAYRSNHSTETAILSTLDHIYHSCDLGMSTVLVSLDLSAAFDTVDHSILLNRLKTSFGLSGTVWAWLESYLSYRTQSVRLGNHSSSSVSLFSGVPQGSVLGPLLFAIYTSPIAHICSTYSVNQRQYADDTQLFIALSPSNFTGLISNLENCLSTLHSWFCLNGLALNPDKSDAILFGTRQRAHCYTDVTTVNVAGAVISLADRVKILGVTLDSRLTMDDHVAAVCKAAMYHIRALRQIRPAITDDVAKTVACSIVGARLDYANSALYGVSQKNIHRLQRIQNILARVVAGRSITSAYCNSSDLLYQLHWLPIDFRLKFKLAKLAYISCSSSSPPYLASLVSSYTPSRALRSINTHLLTVPKFRLQIATRGFRVAAPTVFNSLPHDVRTASSLSVFTSRLKTFYFKSAFFTL